MRLSDVCSRLCLYGFALGVLSSPAQAAVFRSDLIQLDPFSLMVKDGGGERLDGLLVDILNEFERRTGHSVEKTMTPYARVESDLESGACDFSIMAWGDARAKYANRGAVFFPLDFGVRAAKGISVKDYDELKNITIGTVRGLKVDPRYDADTSLRKDWIVDYTMGVRKTATHHGSDAVAGSIGTINYIINKMGYEAEFGETLVFRTTHLTVSYSKKARHIALEREVNQAFQAMVDDGTVARITEKWFKGFVKSK